MDIRSHVENWLQKNSTIKTDLEDVTVGEKLGQGFSSVVYKCSLLRESAIKFLTLPDSFKQRERFLYEYKNILKIVNTGAVIPLYHYGTCDMDDVKIPYIIMDLCIKNLENKYKDKKIDNENEFRLLLNRLLLILKSIHDAGIIHRDIKPNNILQLSNGDWVLGDFGISWFNPALYEKRVETDKDERLANFDFSAPEQSKRGAYDNPTCSMDIYALGQTLYYCVMGNTIKGSGYRPLSQVVPALRKYDLLIDKMVRQEPSERFQSVSEIQEFLKKQERKSSRPRPKTMGTVEEQGIAFNVALLESISHLKPNSDLGKRFSFTSDETKIHKVMSSLANYHKKK